MNLIEQLGGYEKAKDMRRYLFCYVDGDHYMDVDAALLEYRRQHNIFEAGGRIVIDGKYDKTFMPVLTILGEGKNYYYCDDGQVHKHLMNQWRHATDAEIKAGCRL